MEPPAERLCKLPAFRPVAVQLLSEFAHEEPELDRVVKLLQSDPAFSAEVLTLANSALYARRTRICSIPIAIRVIGLERTRALTASVAMQAMVRNQMNQTAVQDCWAHSRAAALIAEWLAPHYDIHPDQAYTAALIHDIGRLGMLSAYPEYQPLLASAAGENHELLEAERHLLTVDHCEAGRLLAGIWGLPDEFAETSARHHDPVTGTAGDGLDLTRLSCLLAQSLDFRAAPRVECEPAELLIQHIPHDGELRISIPELSEYVWNAIQADGGGIS